MNRYEIAAEIHPDLPTRAELLEEAIWDEIERSRKAHAVTKTFNPDTDWDDRFPLPPF